MESDQDTYKELERESERVPTLWDPCHDHYVSKPEPTILSPECPPPPCIVEIQKQVIEIASIQRKKKDDDSKAEQALSKVSDDLKKQVAQLNQSVMDTIATIKTQQEKNDERFDKLLNLILSKK